MSENELNKECYECKKVTMEEMRELPFHLRRAYLIEEANRKLRKNKETDDYDYIDLHGINKVLLPLKIKYLITDEPVENKRPGLKIIDMVTGKEMFEIFVPWPDKDDQFGMTNAQIIGANITYLRRYLIMWAYDLSSGDMLDNKVKIPEVNVSAAASASDMPELLKMSNQETVIPGAAATDLEEEEFFLNPSIEQTNTKNILVDAQNYIMTTGPFAGMCLGDIYRNNKDMVIDMAKDNSNPQLATYCNILLRN